MRAIIEAIDAQEILAVWRGPEPADGTEITHAYLNDIVDGLPRLQYAEGETNRIDVRRLAADFDKSKAAHRADKINVEAQRRIIAIAPEWKQRNWIARSVELLRIGPANWTPAEQAEADAIQAQWDQIKAIRDASNAAIDNANDTIWPT